MNTIAFVLWLVLWMPMVELSNYLAAKKREMYGHVQPNTEAVLKASGIVVVIWVVIAILLYGKI